MRETTRMIDPSAPLARERGRPRRRATARWWRTGLLAGAVLWWLSAACSGETPTTPTRPPPPPPPPPPPASVATSVAVSPSSAVLAALGDTAAFAAEVRDQRGAVMTGATVGWSSSATEVVAVAATGVVTAVGNGTATVTATAGQASAAVEITVRQVAAAVAVGADTVSFSAVGDTATVTATVSDANGHAVEDAAVAWSSADTRVVTVSASGLVTAVGEGSARITAASGDLSGTAIARVAVVPVAIVLDPAQMHLRAVGDTGTVTATVSDANGNTMEDAAIAWSSADPAVASVTSAGLVTAIALGATEVTAAAGGVEASARIIVRSISSDRDALVLLFETTKGPSWVRSDNWLTDRPLSEWYGVATDYEGRVEFLDLPANGLVGNLPAALGRLTRLRNLSLDGNELSGPLPARRWRDLVELGGLFLQNNPLTGELPPELAALRGLVTIDLRETDFTGAIPAEWGELPDLRYLGLTGTGVRGPIPATFTRLSGFRLDADRTGICLPREPVFDAWQLTAQLNGVFPCVPETADRDILMELYAATDGPRWTSSRGWGSRLPLGMWEGVESDDDGYVTSLTLHHNNLSGRLPARLGELPRLETLKLTSNRLRGSIPPEWGNLANLRILMIGDNPLEGSIPPELGQLTALDSLYLAWTGISGSIPPELGNLTKLKSLELYNNQLSGEIPSRLGNLASLRSLALSNNALTGSIPPELGRLASLTEMTIFSNRLSGPIPPDLAALSQLERFNAQGNRLSGEIPPELGRLGRLTHLYLNRNQLRGTIPAALGDLGELRVLWLFLNELGGDIPPELGRLRNLRSLILADNPLSGPIPPALGGLSALERLNLTRTGLTGRIPPELGNLGALRMLSLSETGLSGPLPPELGRLGALEQLYVVFTELSGLIPRSFVNLPVLGEFLYYQTNLCAPLDGEVRRWLAQIPNHQGNECAATDVERLALAEVYDRMGGEAWHNRDGWGGGAPVGTWHGVRTGDDGRVVDLSLRANGLAGALAGEVANFTALEVLDVGENAIEGGLPEGLAGLGRLRELRLDGNQGLAGALPFAFTSLANLGVFQFHDTGLCASPAPTFQAWWLAIGERSGASCDNAAEVRLAIPSVHLTQSVQDSAGRVTLLSGRDALLRVFVTGDREGAYYEPGAVAEFRRGGEVVHRAALSRAGDRVPTSIAEGRMDLSFNAVVPGSVVTAGTELVVDVDPEGVVPRAAGSRDRFPAAGALALDVVDVPPLELTVVPVVEADDPDWSIREWTDGISADSPQLGLLRHAFPIVDMEARTRAPYLTSLDLTNEDHTWLLALELEALREMENGTGYYYGAAASKRGYVRGIARVDGWVSMGKPWATELAHEVGHSMNLYHAPCGGAAFADPDFPYAGGGIGVWGYDFRDGSLVSPENRRDIMGYCYELGWISDYHFTRALAHRLRREGAAAARPAPAPRDVLVLWGGVLNGELRLEPAFSARTRPRLPETADGPYRLRGLGADGEAMFSYGFVPGEDKYGNRYFYFAVPVGPDWAGSLERVALTGPEGSAVLEVDEPRPISVVRDGAGRLRAILRDWSGPLPDALRGVDGLDVRGTRDLRDALRPDRPR